MESRDELFAYLRDNLEKMFEVPRDKITLDARLYEDLDLDSIDAVDLVVKLQEHIGKRIKPDAFKAVRTVQDVVDCMHDILSE
jgi:acyl carrier protein